MSEVHIPEQLRDKLTQTRARLLADGTCPSVDRLQGLFSTFRQRFGPDVLRALEGEELLTVVHNHGDRDSLVYWLEFKNDEEFPAVFGSIAGGSALKFGLYRRQETGTWMTGTSKNQRELSTREAIEIAGRHRDQLVRGAELLDALPTDATVADYQRLHVQMEQQAPDVCNTAWGHKYFHLTSPEKIEDFHVTSFQRYYLLKLLISPPSGDERYEYSATYSALCRYLDMPMNHLTRCLGAVFGRPRRTRRLMCHYAKPDRDGWPIMRDGGFAAVGWRDLPDMSPALQAANPRAEVIAMLDKHLGERKYNSREASQLTTFAQKMEEGDTVLACHGAKVHGVGVVTGPYMYDADGGDWPHRRAVQWLDTEEWTHTALNKRVQRVVQSVNETELIVECERRKLDGRPVIDPPIQMAVLQGVPRRIEQILERKAQVVLYGPPGTGKTYWAKKASTELAARHNLRKSYDALTEPERDQLLKVGSVVRSCTFHPAYGYEDFIEGYRPTVVDGNLQYELRNGVFKKLCEDARSRPDQSYYLIIDEINRGDIPRIFGELLTLLEKDKRDEAVLLPVSGETFSVPQNVFVIGTMNTADRSIALLDAALRRRFGFVELMPDSRLLDGVAIDGMDLRSWFDQLNARILEQLGTDARNLQIGHAYLLTGGQPIRTVERLARIVREDIVPLIQEYCYEDTAALEAILGKGLYDRARQAVRDELFAPGQEQELIQALAEPAPSVLATAGATGSVDEDVDDSAENEDLDDDEAGDEGAESETR